MGIDIVVWIIFGTIAGYLSVVVLDGAGYGVYGNIAIGIMGAILGGLAGKWFNFNEYPVFFVNVSCIITSILGALTILFFAGFMKPNPKHR